MQNRVQFILLTLMLLLLGCGLTEESRPGSWLSRFTPSWAGPSTAGQIEVAMIEDALPSNFLAERIWQEVDEQVVPLEQRPVFEANGVRLGVVNGACSLKLQEF